MIRLFVAYPLPPEWTKLFSQISEKNLHLEKIRWTPAINLHITLFFIGEVNESDLDKIETSLKNTLNNHRAFLLDFEAVELRGNPARPSMVWASFRKNDLFSKLSEQLFHSVKEYMTIHPTHKDPLPHCTLARIQKGAQTDSLNKTLLHPATPLTIDRAELWKTIQEKEGVRYDRLMSVELRK